MNINRASQLVDLPVKTIRYYEEIALVVPARAANQYRVYSDADIHKLRFISKARALGFSIEDCRALLSLYENKFRESRDVRMLANRHLADIDKKITELEAMRDSLSELIHACKGDTRPDCPILRGLSGKDPQKV